VHFSLRTLEHKNKFLGVSQCHVAATLSEHNKCLIYIDVFPHLD
jgi:hypothetical protein